MRTFVDLIDSMKPGVVAQAIGVSQKHVHTMRARNSIPPIYWGDLIAAAEKVGIAGLTYEKCRELRAEAPAPVVRSDRTTAESSTRAA